MSCAKPSPNLPVKIGPPISVRRSQRIKGSTMPPTKVQPMKSCHQRIKGPHGIQDTTTGDKAETGDESSLVTWHPTIQLCMTDEERKQQYLDSFRTKMVTLSNGQQLHPHVALQQLHAGVISKEDIVQDDDCDEGSLPLLWMETSPNHVTVSLSSSLALQMAVFNVKESSDKHSDWSTDKRHSLKLEQTRREFHNGNYDFDHHPSTPPLEFPSSSEDEDAITDIEDNSPKTKRKYACPLTEVGMSQATLRTVDEGVDTDGAGGTEERSLNLKCGRLPMEAIHEVQALGMRTMQEAQVIADKYGKMLVSIMSAAGLTSKATWVESVWNMHQAWPTIELESLILYPVPSLNQDYSLREISANYGVNGITMSMMYAQQH
ncbi:hypothetical protein EDC04DRAFT_2602037 [Pisolithus marmoratus]|nr:hypothetical protein EDC04DRAFT_2602037 [Pisolithus marmoratus]